MQVRCHNCGGQGMVSVYSAEDFEGADECEDCGGTGKLHVTETGRLQAWQGGPFRGRLSAQELEELAKRRERATT